jgi:hypothetical protein
VDVSAAGAVTGCDLVRGQRDQASARMTTTAATLAHIAQPGRSRNGVVRKSGFGRLKSLVIGIPPMRHQPWFNQKVPHHRLGAGPSQTSIAQKTQIAKTFDGERFEQKFTISYNYRSPW